MGDCRGRVQSPSIWKHLCLSVTSVCVWQPTPPCCLLNSPEFSASSLSMGKQGASVLALPGASLTIFTLLSPHPGNLLTSKVEESSFLWLFTSGASIAFPPPAPAMEMFPVEITLQLAQSPSSCDIPPIRDSRAGRMGLAQGCGVKLFQEMLGHLGAPCSCNSVSQSWCPCLLPYLWYSLLEGGGAQAGKNIAS